MSRDNKTILYLMEYPIDLPGGGQESTKTLCEGLLQRGGYSPVVACPTLLSSKPSDYPYKVICFSSDENRELSKFRRIKNFLDRIGHFKRIIREVSPDLIHVSMSESLITFGALRVPGMFRDIPFVYTDRGLRFGYRKHSLFCIKTTMKRASRMLTTTAYNASLWNDLSVPITVIPNTISGAFEEYDDTRRQQKRRQYDIADGVPVIGFAGRISEEKNWDKVPGVVAAIADAGIKPVVALVLSVYEKRDEMIARTITDGIIKAVGPDNLIYMHDLDQRAMSDYYYLVDIFVMTSNFESFGKAAVEAMSRKCVVLSTAVGGLPEVIGNSRDLYDIEDLTTLTDRMKQLLCDPSQMEREREMFYSRYRDNYTIDRNIEGHIRVYEEILGR